MLRRLINWFKGDPPPAHRKTTQMRQHSSSHTAVRADAERSRMTEPTPEFSGANGPFEGQVETTGPGKNVLTRNKYIREDTGTHETLKILDDSLVDSGEEDGIDPYNSGEFDRSRHWNKRFRD